MKEPRLFIYEPVAPSHLADCHDAKSGEPGTNLRVFWKRHAGHVTLCKKCAHSLAMRLLDWADWPDGERMPSQNGP
jgi:hypothetical protein